MKIQWNYFFLYSLQSCTWKLPGKVRSDGHRPTSRRLVRRQAAQRRPGTLGECQRLGMSGICLQPLLQRLALAVIECVIGEQYRPLGGRLTDAPLLQFLANQAHSWFSL